MFEHGRMGVEQHIEDLADHQLCRPCSVLVVFFLAAAVMNAMRPDVVIAWLPAVMVGMDPKSEAARRCLERGG